MHTPFIQNVSFSAVKDGMHMDAGDHSVLIQIVDPGVEFPVPKKTFKECHQFSFKDDETGDGIMTDDQAEKMSNILKDAIQNHKNVIVHCMAGLCRSGAIAEAGVRMGFIDSEAARTPNLHVLNLTLNHLGLLKSEDYYKQFFSNVNQF